MLMIVFSTAWKPSWTPGWRSRQHGCTLNQFLAHKTFVTRSPWRASYSRRWMHNGELCVSSSRPCDCAVCYRECVCVYIASCNSVNLYLASVSLFVWVSTLDMFCYSRLNCLCACRRGMMKQAVVNTKALVVVAQDRMLENLEHSEVSTVNTSSKTCKPKFVFKFFFLLADIVLLKLCICHVILAICFLNTRTAHL